MKKLPDNITLSPGEIISAGCNGVYRTVESIKSGRKGGQKRSPEKNPSRLGVDVESACAEEAVAKWLNMYWPAGVETFKEADIGANIQVRYSAYEDARLIIRQDDINECSDHLFFLVTGVCPTYTIRGFIKCKNAIKQEYIFNPGEKDPAYFVPQSSLITSANV